MSLSHPRTWLCRLIAVAALSAAAAPADEPPPPSPAESPIGRFFDRLFQGVGEPPNARPSPGAAAVPVIEAAPRVVPDAIDERAAAGRQQQRDLVRAQRLLLEGERGAALTMLQGLLDADEDTPLLSDEGHWESLQQTTERLIGAGDARLQQEYVARFGQLAEQRLQAARRSGDPRDFAQVTKRFLHTPAGRQAARILAQLARDAGEPVEAAYWLARLGEEGAVAAATAPAQGQAVETDGLKRVRRPAADWEQPFGGATHRGTFSEADPVLIGRWRVPLASRPAVTEQVAWIVRDLVDGKQPCIPAAMPLAVDGKIITRTLRGLSVLDADSGRLLWESVEGVSVERLLAGEEVPHPGGELSERSMRPITPYRGTGAENHPLANLLFRDGVYGLLSSDRDQVFVLEDHASLSYRQPGYFWGQRMGDDVFERDWASNRLAAYDIETGAVRWRIGGPRQNEPFDSPLAGTLFLGPPVVEGEELFLIGEQGGTVRLFVLDRHSGTLQWAHVVSEAGAEIEQDLVRRWWPAQPAVGRGIIVCPTTSGWLVAIDRLERRIRWTYRYIESRQQKVSSNRSRIAPAGPLNSRWCPSAPVLTQRHVVFTPPELPDPLYGQQPLLVCLDVLTGERLWRTEKEDRLYVGGVVGDRVLLVGEHSVEARELASGEVVWQTSLEARSSGQPGTDVGPPSGRGIIAGDEFLLPLQSRQLWMLGLADGAVRRTLSLRDEDPPLGNLLLHEGRLVSLGPFAVRCFEERAAMATSVAAATDSGAPPAAKLRTAQLQLVDGDLAGARATLHRLHLEEMTQADRSDAEALLWDTLVGLVRETPEAADAEFAELAGLAETGQQRLTVERLRADRLLERGQLTHAFDVYWQQARAPQSTMVTEGPVRVRFDRWIAGRLERLWDSAGDDVRRRIDERVAQVVDAQLGEAGPDLPWWAEVLQFHPEGPRLRRPLAEAAIADGDKARAEIHLMQILESAGAQELQVWALEQLIGLMEKQGRVKDVSACLERYADRVPDAEAARSALAALRADEARPDVSNWSEGHWKLSRTPASFNQAMFEPVLAIQPGLASVEELRLRVEPYLHRLAIETPNGEPLWETPLRMQSDSFFNHTTAVASVGQLLLVVHRGVLQAVSVADRELLWQQDFDIQAGSGGYVRAPSLLRQREARVAGDFVWAEGLRQMRSPMGMLGVWRAGYLAYYGRHTITAADPLTGETLWTRGGIPPRTMIHGTSRTLYVVPPAPEDPYALSVRDGTLLEMPRLALLLPRAVAVQDAGLVLIERQVSLGLFRWGTTTTRVRLVDPRDGSEHWSLSFPEQTRFAHLGDDELLAATPDGAVSTIDFRTGSEQPLGEVGAEALRETQRLFVIPEPAAGGSERLYLAFNRPPKPGSYSRSYQSVPVHGTLAAFDRQAGLQWSETVEDQNLIVDQLPHLPVLVFASQRPERNGDVTSQQVSIELRDKQTGRLLLQDSRYITGGNIRELEIDPARQLIDLKTYNDRLRLSVAAD